MVGLYYVHFLILVLVIFGLCSGSQLTHAADVKDIFGSILGELGREIERKQQRSLDRKLKPLWQACAKGNVAACDSAARFPLNAKGRENLRRMRALAERRPQFEQDWIACENLDIEACRAALNYPGLNHNGYDTLQAWHRRAVNSKRQEIERQKYTRYRLDCLSDGTLSACIAALGYTNFNYDDRNMLVDKRNKIRDQHKRQRAAKAARLVLQSLSQRCFAGQHAACVNAISHPNANGDLRVRLITKRNQLLARQQKRKRQQAERRQYNQLRTDCLERELRESCLTAAKSKWASNSDLTRINHKQIELASFTEQLIATFSKVRIPLDFSDHGFFIIGAGVLIIMLAVMGIVLLIRFLFSSTDQSHAAASSGPPPVPEPDTAPHSPFATTFPLTGHLPSDVRKVLYG